MLKGAQQKRGPQMLKFHQLQSKPLLFGIQLNKIFCNLLMEV